ncbi:MULTISPECIES: GNAT family N-acetyltransferase [unclassified Streptomyces]|uniref:GNAT family N-acetyltransferase n=1 Tax=unclassified Streptomyces TaxID=2593676 RepID=UPI002E145D22|nr:GNAT family N-acetyltransferase [Streptomyces sp. NBC_01197]WSS50200.1 GNAT family N-acetyltransferase [Streptomyces sp. NBC_01180]
MDDVIRPVRADEWLKVKELRLVALQDPAAPIAYLETYEAAIARPDSFWQDRAAGASHGGSSRQFIAEGPDGVWSGTVVVLVEPVGAEGIFGELNSVAQAHLVGVYVRPESRGVGVTQELFRAAMEWAWSLDEPRIERVRLFVHQANRRAAGFYRKVGFVPTGYSVPAPGDAGERELEMVVDRPA